jgi:transcriptional regulator with XRE-family HTH domain
VDARSREKIAGDLRATAGRQGWPPWRLTQAVHEMAGTPTLLMAWRLASGQTQEQVAAGLRGLAADHGTPCAPSPSKQQLSRWENGHESPGRLYGPLLGLWYRTTASRLGLADDDPIVTNVPAPAAAEEDEDVDRRQFLQLAAAAPLIPALDETRRKMNADLRHVMPADELSRWSDIADANVAAYGQRPPAQLLASLQPDLADLADLTSGYPRERDLNLVAARLCGLTGALHTDLGNDRQASDWLHTAARYASLSGDTSQQYWVAVAQAMSALYGKQPSQVITIAARARTRLGDHPYAPAAQLAGLAARAHANAGHADEARAELGHAGQLLGGSAPDSGFFGFPDRELLMYQSAVLTSIGDPAAPDAQAQALAAYPADDPMDRPLIRLDQARYLADQARDPHAAAQAALGAITDLPAPLRVPLLVAQARAVAPAISALSPHAAGRYNEELTALTA